MEHRFRKVRKQLDDLGYLQILVPDSLPLVEKLVADLIQTTDSLRKYKEIAKDAIEERDNLRLGAEPYKCDNAKLVKECNDLHLAFLQFREQNEKLQGDLKRNLAHLEQEKLDCYGECEKLKKQIRDLQYESAQKTDRILNIRNKNLRTAGSKGNPALASKIKSASSSKSKIELTTTMALADQKIANLTKEIKRLKDEYLQLTELNESYKNQLNNRDREIERLTQMLEGGRPIQALNQDCCYKDVEAKMYRLKNEISCLEKEKLELETRLKDSVTKQHDAMKRALSLADRNKQLEQELRDIDQMALTVEADCNKTVKNNAEKLSRLQQKVHETVLQIQTLEREVRELKHDKQEVLSDLEVLKIEKKDLQIILETALDDKKRLNDKINQFTIIEHDLNLEIDRLVQTSASQKRKIAELEGRLLEGKLDAVSEHSIIRDYSPIKPIASASSPKRKLLVHKRKIKPRPVLPELNVPKMHAQPKPKKKQTHRNTKVSKQDVPHNSPNFTPNFHSPERVPGTDVRCNCCCCCNCHNNSTNQAEPTGTADHFKSERDYYMKEYHRVLGQLQNIPGKPDNNAELLRKLNECEQLVATLQRDNKILAQEKHNLMGRLETARDRLDGESDGLSLKSTVRKLERERDILKGDITRLEEERDAIRQRLKATMENQVAEHARMEKALVESNDEIKRLEQDRRDLMQSQGSRRATISNLEEQCQTLKDQLRLCQTELNQQRTLYSQLKALQEQTDKALADCQGQLSQTESELDNSQKRIRSLEKDRGQLEQELTRLRNDIVVMKRNLTQGDQEKDSLLIAVDDKTERIAALEQELRAKDGKLLTVENASAELKKKLSMTIDNSSSREQLLRTASVESANLRQELETALRAKDSAIKENRRLQDDLSACTVDCRCAQNELEMAKRQIEDLKRQLQHYVAEVKRFEDLITEKEMERNELLDQFRSLSQEAIVLENNNHSLENEATQSKVQLSVTLDHVADLETKLNTQDSIIGGYEKQIAEFTSQIANMESQLSHYRQKQERTEADLASVRDLCMKLDKQKENLMKELTEKEDQQAQIDRNILRLRRESETLQNSLTKDRHSIESLEQLLADSRQDAVKQKIINEELEAEILSLRQKIEEYQSRLMGTSEQLDYYQQKALDYSQQNKQLRRDIASERFFRAKEEEGKRSPATATFTYSTNMGAVLEKNICICCENCPGQNKKIGDKGEVIDRASAVIASGRPQMNMCKCCGKCKMTESKESEERKFLHTQSLQSNNYPSVLLQNDNNTSLPSNKNSNSSSNEKQLKSTSLSHKSSNQSCPGICICTQGDVCNTNSVPKTSKTCFTNQNVLCTCVSSIPTQPSGYGTRYSLVRNSNNSTEVKSTYKQ